MFDNIREYYSEELSAIKEAGLYKSERVITTPQAATINTQNKEVLNFCANNYLGLSSHPEVLEAAIETIKTHGFGMSSVRFICGTQDIHKELSVKLLSFWVQKIVFCMLRLSMPMVVFLNHFWVRKMP